MLQYIRPSIWVELQRMKAERNRAEDLNAKARKALRRCPTAYEAVTNQGVGE